MVYDKVLSFYQNKIGAYQEKITHYLKIANKFKMEELMQKKIESVSFKNTINHKKYISNNFDVIWFEYSNIGYLLIGRGSEGDFVSIVFWENQKIFQSYVFMDFFIKKDNFYNCFILDDFKDELIINYDLDKQKEAEVIKKNKEISESQAFMILKCILLLNCQNTKIEEIDGFFHIVNEESKSDQFCFKRNIFNKVKFTEI